MDDERIPSDEQWVSELLASQDPPAAPDDVVDSVLAAIRREQATREQAGRAKRDPLDELLGRTSTGTFGANAPSHYDKKGLGMGHKARRP